jgi:uncharacterized protein YgiM (DUF1202 family)
VNNTLLNVLKGIVGVVLLLILVSTVNRWWGDYRTSAQVAPAPESTATPTGGEGSQDSTTEASGDESKTDERKKVVVLTNGLNFRETASRDGKVIRGLDKDDELVLIKTEDGWHHVEDSEGVKGYISASETYSEVK